MKRKTLTVLAAFTLVLGLGLAQNMTNDTDQTPEMQQNMNGVETVIIASSESHTDPAVADAASDTSGVPVLLTEPDSLSEPTAEILEEQQVENAIIVGGEAAVSEEVESEINSITESTDRVAGETASETSLEVASYFWEDANEAVVVQAPLMEDRESTYRLASAAANIGEPLILADADSEISSELEDQEISQATVYSLTAEANGQNMTDEEENQTDNTTETPEAPAQGRTELAQSLEEAGITAEVNTGSVDELASQLYDRIQENSDNRKMYAVTGANFEYGIPTYAHPTAVTYIVTDGNLEEDVQYLQDSEFDPVTVIGEQNLGQQITGELEDAEYVQVDSPVETSAEIFRENAPQWAALEPGVIGGPETEEEEDMTETPEDETEAPTEDTPENETQNQTEDTLTGPAESSIDLDSSGDTITAEATYTSDQAYDQVRSIQQNQTHIVFTFGLVPDGEEPAGNEYQFQEDITELESGSYQTQAQLIVKDQIIDEETDNITIS